jgi:hypothetical protein
MLGPQQVVDDYFLETRHMLLEVAAHLDRYDAAVDRTGGEAPDPRKLEMIRQALAVIRSPAAGQPRTVQLLELFAQL